MDSNIGRLNKNISQSSTEHWLILVAHAFITTKLYYGLLHDVPYAEDLKLQRIQNTATRLMDRAMRAEHASPILQKLHWLSVKEGITF